MSLFSVAALALILESVGSLCNKINCRLIHEHIKSLDYIQDSYEGPFQTYECTKRDV